MGLCGNRGSLITDAIGLPRIEAARLSPFSSRSKSIIGFQPHDNQIRALSDQSNRKRIDGVVCSGTFPAKRGFKIIAIGALSPPTLSQAETAMIYPAQRLFILRRLSSPADAIPPPRIRRRYLSRFQAGQTVRIDQSPSAPAPCPCRGTGASARRRCGRRRGNTGYIRQSRASRRTGRAPISLLPDPAS